MKASKSQIVAILKNEAGITDVAIQGYEEEVSPAVAIEFLELYQGPEEFAYSYGEAGLLYIWLN